MSLEQRLINQYQKSAKVADMGGYGLTGGVGGMDLQGQDNAAINAYQSQLMNAVHGEGALSGGKKSRGKKRGKGSGLSGGMGGHPQVDPQGGFFPGASFLLPLLAKGAYNLVRGKNVVTGDGVSGGMPSGGMAFMGKGKKGMYYDAKMPPPFIADGLSGGDVEWNRSGQYNPYGPMSAYPHSFPTPGFYPGPPLPNGGGEGLSGGRARKPKDPNRVAAGKQSAGQSAWIKRVKAFQQETGMSYKQALIELGKKNRNQGS